MKLTKKQIDMIRAHTPPELKGRTDRDVQINETLGLYYRPDWNWCYQAGWKRDGHLVVTRFGEVM